MPIYISPPPQSPLTRIIAGIIAVFVLIGTFTIGMVAFLVVAGIGLIAGIALWLRISWIKHRLRKSGVDMGAGAGAGVNIPRQSGHVIDAEYTVVSDTQEDHDK
jgi:hypothetical protein